MSGADSAAGAAAHGAAAAGGASAGAAVAGAAAAGAAVPVGGGVAYSVVVPFYDEAESAPRLLAEIDAAMGAIGEPWELLMVDDGSRDGTGEILAAAAAGRDHYRYLRLPRNRGQAVALDAGLRRARGAVVATLDGDGQNDPADIPALLAELGSADMVVGVRVGRRDGWLRRRMSRLANGVRGRLLGDRMHDSGCALKVFRREVVDSLLPLATLYSFMPALAAAAGFRLAELPVRHRPRLAGRTSYGLRAFLWRPALDLLGVWWYQSRSFARREVAVEEVAVEEVPVEEVAVQEVAVEEVAVEEVAVEELPRG